MTRNLVETRRLYGVVVAAIPAEFAAINPRLKPGDIIYEMNAEKIHSLEELRAVLAKLKPGDPIVVLTERDGTLGSGSFTLE